MRRKIYTVGFMFDQSKQFVALQTRDPGREDMKWQKGLLNGVGGGLEREDGTYAHGMAREFHEETHIFTLPGAWTQFASLENDHIQVHAFWSTTRFDFLDRALRIPPEPLKEEVKLYRVMDIHKQKMMPNLHWMIPLACCTEEYRSPPVFGLLNPPDTRQLELPLEGGK